MQRETVPLAELEPEECRNQTIVLKRSMSRRYKPTRCLAQENVAFMSSK